MAEVDEECQMRKNIVGKEEPVSLCRSCYDGLEVYMNGSSDQLVNCHPKGVRDAKSRHSKEGASGLRLDCSKLDCGLAV